jgi:hypothetical protein
MGHGRPLHRLRNLPADPQDNAHGHRQHAQLDEERLEDTHAFFFI